MQSCSVAPVLSRVCRPNCPLGRCSLIAPLRQAHSQPENGRKGRWRGYARKGVVVGCRRPDTFGDLDGSVPHALGAVCVAFCLQVLCASEAPAVELKDLSARESGSGELVAIERKRLEDMVVGEVSDRRVHRMSEDQLLGVLEELLHGAPHEVTKTVQADGTMDRQGSVPEIKDEELRSSASGVGAATPTSADGSHSRVPPEQGSDGDGFLGLGFESLAAQQPEMKERDGLPLPTASPEEYPLSARAGGQDSPSETYRDANSSMEESVAEAIERQVKAMMLGEVVDGDPQTAMSTGGERSTDEGIPGLSSWGVPRNGELPADLLPDLQRKVSQALAQSLNTLFRAEQESGVNEGYDGSGADPFGFLVNLLPENINLPRALAAGKTAVVGGAVLWFLLWVPEMLRAVDNSTRATISRLPWMSGSMDEAQQHWREGSKSAPEQPVASSSDRQLSSMGSSPTWSSRSAEDATNSESPYQEIWSSKSAEENDDNGSGGQGVLWRRDDNDANAYYREYSQFVPNWVVEGDTSAPVAVPSDDPVDVPQVSVAPSKQGLELLSDDREDLGEVQEGRQLGQLGSSADASPENDGTLQTPVMNETNTVPVGAPDPGVLVAGQRAASNEGAGNSEGSETMEAAPRTSMVAGDREDDPRRMAGPQADALQQSSSGGARDGDAQPEVSGRARSSESPSSEAGAAVSFGNRVESLWSNVDHNEDPSSSDYKGKKSSSFWRLHRNEFLRPSRNAVQDEANGNAASGGEWTPAIDPLEAGVTRSGDLEIVSDAKGRFESGGPEDESLVFGNVDKVASRGKSRKLLQRLLQKQ